MISPETIHCIALTLLPRIKPSQILELYNAAGCASVIMENRRDLRAIAPEASPRMCEIIESMDTALQKAEKEAEFVEKHGIKCLTIADRAYPSRLKSCIDAPLVLFTKGSADLNTRHVVSVVGTRHCTEYGKDMCRRFTGELASVAPGTLVVSGLALSLIHI